MDPSSVSPAANGAPGGGPRPLLIAFLALPAPPPWRQYAVTTLVIAFTTLIWFSLQHSVTSLPFLLFISAVFLISLVYGRHAGFLSIGLSVVALVVLFADPLFRFRVESADDLLALVLFGLIGCGIALLTDALRQIVRFLHSTLDTLAAADREKDILLREVHHRIRNDLQMIVMQLHMARAQEDNQAGALDRAIECVSIMSRLYERLRRQDGARVVDAVPYLQQIVSDLQLTRAGSRLIRMHADIEPARLGMPTALALGIVVNELVTNALKYAFPTQPAGRIDVTFRRAGEGYELAVEDDGVGLVSEAPQGSGLGRQIIQQFAEQLGGRFEIQPRAQGLRAVLTFPCEHAVSVT